MKLATKVIIFISSISIVTTILIYSIIKDNYSNLIKLENNLVNNKIQNLLDNINLSNEEIKHTLDFYNNNIKILEILNSYTNDKIEELFVRDNFTNLFLLNEKKEIIKSIIYNRDSEEFYGSNQKLSLFKEDLDFNYNNIHFTTYDYEKILFNIIKVDNQNLNYKYIIIGKALDSKFLSFITRLTDSYISLIFNRKIEDNYRIINGEQQYNYNIERNDEKDLYAYLRLKDLSNNTSFYLSMKVNRSDFSKVMKNNKIIFYIFIFTIFLSLLSSYLFISKIFTTRINTIIEKIKKISKNNQLKTKIYMNYNDEITYLSNKLNDMFLSIDTSQHEKIKKERDFLQSILDAQQNIILITDGSDIRSTNKRFNEHFDSKELFLTNLALLDDKVKNNFLEIIKNYNSYDKPAKIKISDNKDGYFIFDIKKIDIENYIINMNDVSKINEEMTILKEKATFDQLTNIYNKSTLLNIGKEWFKYRNFSIIIIDIDFFKKVNDTHGHIYGDYILRDCSKILKNSLRKFDIIGRFGGEEFVIYIENNDIENIENICNNLRKKIENFEFKYDEISIKITASFGFTTSENNLNFDDFFKSADKALYQAKELGRNRVCYFIQNN